jgi:hypothetical protein
MDKGGEYRHMVGLPGGINSPLFNHLEMANNMSGMKMSLIEGKGDEGDNLGKRSIYVYDSNKFPFHQAEVYHQFHDGRKLSRFLQYVEERLL